MDQDREVSSRPDRQIRKKTIKSGNYNIVPYEDSRCRISVSGVKCVNDSGACSLPPESQVLRSTFEGVIVIGDSDCYLDKDVELLLQTMCDGEICDATFTYQDHRGRLAQEITCQIELKETMEEQLISDWSWQRLHSQAVYHKEKGVELVKEKKIIDAFTRFSRALRFLIAIEPINPEVVPEETVKEIIDLRVKLYNNLAHCQLQFKEYSAALELCNKTLQYEPENIKALYRRCLAHNGLNMIEEAWSDIQKVLALDSNDKLAQQKASMLKPKLDKMKENYSIAIKKMFVQCN